MERIDASVLDLQEKVVAINRVSKTVKGGRVRRLARNGTTVRPGIVVVRDAERGGENSCRSRGMTRGGFLSDTSAQQNN